MNGFVPQRQFARYCLRKGLTPYQDGYVLDWNDTQSKAILRANGTKLQCSVALKRMPIVIAWAKGEAPIPLSPERPLFQCDDCGDRYGPGVKRCKCGCTLFKTLQPDPQPSAPAEKGPTAEAASPTRNSIPSKPRALGDSQ